MDANKNFLYMVNMIAHTVKWGRCLEKYFLSLTIHSYYL